MAWKRRVNRITKTGPGGGVDACSTTVLELVVPAGAGRLTDAYGTFCLSVQRGLRLLLVLRNEAEWKKYVEMIILTNVC